MPTRRRMEVRAEAKLKRGPSSRKSKVPPVVPAAAINGDTGNEGKKEAQAPTKVETVPPPTNQGDCLPSASTQVIGDSRLKQDQLNKTTKTKRWLGTPTPLNMWDASNPKPVNVWEERTKARLAAYKREEEAKAALAQGIDPMKSRAKEIATNEIEFIPLCPPAPPHPSPNPWPYKYSDVMMGKHPEVAYASAPKQLEVVKGRPQSPSIQNTPPARRQPCPKPQLVQGETPKNKDQASGGEPITRPTAVAKAENATQTKNLPVPISNRKADPESKTSVERQSEPSIPQCQNSAQVPLVPPNLNPLEQNPGEDAVRPITILPVILEEEEEHEISTHASLPEKLHHPIVGTFPDMIPDMILTNATNPAGARNIVPSELKEAQDCTCTQAFREPEPAVSHEIGKDEASKQKPEASGTVNLDHTHDVIPEVPIGVESKVSPAGSQTGGSVNDNEEVKETNMSRRALTKKMELSDRIDLNNVANVEAELSKDPSMEMPEVLFRDVPPGAGETVGGSSEEPRLAADTPPTPTTWPPVAPCTCCPYHSIPGTAPPPQVLLPQLPVNYQFFYPPQPVILLNPLVLPPPQPVPVPPLEGCQCVYTKATVGSFRLEPLEVFQSSLEVKLALRKLRSPNSAIHCLLMDSQMEYLLQSFKKRQVLKEVDESAIPINQNSKLDEVFFPLELDNFVLIGDQDKVCSLFKCLGEREDGEVEMIIVLKGEYRDPRGCLLPDACPTGPLFLENLVGGLTRDDAHAQFQEMLDDPSHPFCVCPGKNTQTFVEAQSQQQPLPPPPVVYYL